MIYPEHNWQPYLFSATPRHLHKKWDEVTRFISYVEKFLRIKEPNDWYRVSLDHLSRLGGAQLIAKNGGLYAVGNILETNIIDLVLGVEANISRVYSR